MSFIFLFRFILLKDVYYLMVLDLKVISFCSLRWRTACIYQLGSLLLLTRRI